MGAMRRNMSWEQLRTSEWKQNNYTGYIDILRFVPGQRDTLVSTTCTRVDWQSGTLDSVVGEENVYTMRMTSMIAQVDEGWLRLLENTGCSGY